jgi:hypothetical protein
VTDFFKNVGSIVEGIAGSGKTRGVKRHLNRALMMEKELARWSKPEPSPHS